MAHTAAGSNSEWLTVIQAAEYLGIAPFTLRRWVAEGIIPGYRLGPRSLRFRRSELDAAMRPVPASGGAR